MRAWIIVPLGLIAACSGGGGEEKKTESAGAATSLEAGQWETSFETTKFGSTDKTEPALKAAVGDKETASFCLAAADTSNPPPELFAGEGYDCDYKSSYLRKGRINASLSCERDGIDGQIMMSVEGTFTGTGFEGTAETTTYLPGRGDFAQTRTVSGRRTAETCAEGGAGEGNKAG